MPILGYNCLQSVHKLHYFTSEAGQGQEPHYTNHNFRSYNWDGIFTLTLLRPIHSAWSWLLRLGGCPVLGWRGVTSCWGVDSVLGGRGGGGECFHVVLRVKLPVLGFASSAQLITDTFCYLRAFSIRYMGMQQQWCVQGSQKIFGYTIFLF